MSRNLNEENLNKLTSKATTEAIAITPSFSGDVAGVFFTPSASQNAMLKKESIESDYVTIEMPYYLNESLLQKIRRCCSTSIDELLNNIDLKKFIELNKSPIKSYRKEDYPSQNKWSALLQEGAAPEKADSRRQVCIDLYASISQKKANFDYDGNLKKARTLIEATSNFFGLLSTLETLEKRIKTQEALISGSAPGIKTSAEHLAIQQIKLSYQQFASAFDNELEVLMKLLIDVDPSKIASVAELRTEIQHTREEFKHLTRIEDNLGPNPIVLAPRKKTSQNLAAMQPSASSTLWMVVTRALFYLPFLGNHIKSEQNTSTATDPGGRLSNKAPKPKMD